MRRSCGTRRSFRYTRIQLSNSFEEGNQARPACSRCTERDDVCQYSAERRKPGPVRGAKRRESNNRNASATTRPASDESPSLPETPGLPDRDSNRQSASNTSIVDTPILTTTWRRRRQLAQLQITADEEQLLYVLTLTDVRRNGGVKRNA